jgi:uncharacterized protein (TIGR00255 family)
MASASRTKPAPGTKRSGKFAAPAAAATVAIAEPLTVARSMTGFGRATEERSGQSVTAEIRAVNGRFLKLGVKVLGRYGALEDRVKQLLGELGVKRGSIDVSLFFETGENELGRYTLDAKVAAHYVKQAQALAKALKLKSALTMDALISLPGVVGRDEAPNDIEDVWQVARKALLAAISDFNAMRVREGAAMMADVRVQLSALAAHRAAIMELAPDAQQATLQRFKDRVAKLMERANVSGEIDKNTLEREMVLQSDRMDVAEELARLDSHFQQMEETLTAGGEIGKKLDFLTQELFRETNTIGSKANDERITHRVVEMKSVIERIREQVQNLE